MTSSHPRRRRCPTSSTGCCAGCGCPTSASAAPEVLATAASQRWEPAEVLRVLLAEEAAGRDQATISMRRRASGLPAGKTFDAWDEQASPIPKPTQQALRTLEWIERAESAVRLRPERYRQEPPRRGARASGDRPGQDRRLAHARDRSLRCSAATARMTASAKRVGRLIRADLIVDR